MFVFRTMTIRRQARGVLLTLVGFLAFLYQIAAVSFERVAAGFETIQGHRIQATLQFLASNQFKGRATGTPEAEFTKNYIVSIYEHEGLKPSPSNGGSFVQSFDLIQAIPRQESSITLTSADGDRLDLKIGEDFMPTSWGFDSSMVKRKAVFAGHGLNAPELGYNDYAGLDVADKVVVLLSKLPVRPQNAPWDFYSQRDYEEPFEKVLQAQNAGASGVIIILPSSDTIPSLNTLSFRNCKTTLRVDAEQIRIPSIFVSHSIGQKLVQGSVSTKIENGKDSAEDSLNERTKLLPILLEWTVAMHTLYERKSIQGHNVVGMVPGSDPDLRDQFIILSAHHDHIGVGENQEVFRGADDDASGTTGVLELAQAFQIGLLKPRRSIVFAAWGAEELGLLGSRYYSEHPLFPLNRTVAMIQLDMIGRNEQRPADSAAGIDAEKAEDNGNTVNIAGSAFSPDLKRWIENSNRRIGLTLRYRYDSGQENLLKRSDQWGFLKARIPSTFFFTGFHPDYHKPTDTPDKINYQKMERILKLIYLTIWDVADQAQPPRFVSSLHAP